MIKKAFFLLIWLACVTGSFGQGVPPADSIYKLLAKHPQRDTTRVLLLNQLAYNHYYSSPLQCYREATEARNLADSLHFTKGEADAFRQIGMSFWSQADMATAINYFLSGLKIAQANGHRQVEADILSNIGTAYNGLNNPQEALKFLHQSRQMQQELKNLWREAAVLNNIGDAYTALKDFDKAREAYTFALTIAQKNNYPIGITTNLRNLGNIFELRQQYDSALANYFQCQKLSADIADARGVILSNKSIGSVYLATKKYDLAKKYVNNALNEALKLHLRAFVRDCYELLYKISEASGDRNAAFDYFKLHALYRDSIQNLKTVSDIAADRLRFETEKKQSEIELLKKEREFQATKIRYQNNQILGISLTLALCIVFVIAAVVNYRNIQGKNKLLNKTQAEIQEKNKLLSEKSTELNLLNVELITRQAKILAQRDELIQKNQAIEAMNKQVQGVNQNLEELVKERTQILEDQNKRLTDYAFFNAHELRSPVASILGLVSLMQQLKDEKERDELLVHLEESTKKLDAAIKSINNHLQGGIQ